MDGSYGDNQEYARSESTQFSSGLDFSHQDVPYTSGRLIKEMMV